MCSELVEILLSSEQGETQSKDEMCTDLEPRAFCMKFLMKRPARSLLFMMIPKEEIAVEYLSLR
ncbi:hypothetical protein M514_00360 [Trichuris suis]|uniref:Uncharacterized protein n=1 Tax=Trichuris suis TaxID=68888 RepID=A0A085MN71_9BILA|nr:hypothetical protein M513_00360 [Trichuris suis]KFD68628.1 hypothetical protein M514_00360 [Trichuris suis]